MSACEREGHTYNAWMNSFTLERTEGFSCVYIIYVKISPSKVLYEFKFEIACSTEGSRSAIEGTYSGERKECTRVFLVNPPVDFAQLKYQLEIHSGREYVRRNYARK